MPIKSHGFRLLFKDLRILVFTTGREYANFSYRYNYMI